ncbi:hypothetical protein HO923_01990 [Streptococcus suis]|nr:hypothetical protein [Streptococcus suis]
MGETATGFKNNHIYVLGILLLYVFGVGFIKSELLFDLSVLLIGCVTLILLCYQGYGKNFS